VIATIAPDARVLSLGDGVPPQDVRSGALRLARALPFTPPGVHLAIVDPGVGGPRRAVALRCAAAPRVLVGPDNGLLLAAAERFGGVGAAVDVSASEWRLRPVSATFHGRDVFAPVAARLALGEPLEAAGSPLDPGTLVRLPKLRPRRDGAALVVHVAEVDGFGNVALDAVRGDLPRRDGDALALTTADAAATATLARTFGDVAPGALLLFEDSGGALALAVNGGSAAATLRLRGGDTIRLEVG